LPSFSLNPLVNTLFRHFKTLFRVVWYPSRSMAPLGSSSDEHDVVVVLDTG
jgi:hypothetical protein